MLRAEASGARGAEKRHGETGEAEDVGVDSFEHWLRLDEDSAGDGQGRRTGDGLAGRREPPPAGLAQGLTPFPRLFYRRTQGAASLPGVEDPLNLVAGQSVQKGSLLCYGTAGLAPALLHPTSGAKPGLDFFFFCRLAIFFLHISPMPSSSDVTPPHTHTH